MESKVYTDGQRVFYIDAKSGLNHEITPVCVHCKKIGEIKKCEINPEVVHCCGQCVTSCKNYKRPAQQLELFPSKTIELGANIKYNITSDDRDDRSLASIKNDIKKK